MSKIVRIFAPKTYNKKKQPQLLLVSRTANSIRLHRSDGCLLTTPTTETWAFGSSSIYERFAYLGACCNTKEPHPRLPFFLSPYGALYVLLTINPNRSLGPISSGDVKVFSCSPESKECLPLIHGSHKT